MAKPPPQVPSGNSSIIQGISESLSFHSSPETFIASRLSSLQKTNPELANSRLPIRAKVLNRNVAIFSSYSQIEQILCSNSHAPERGPQYVAREAYDELMSAFFPSPNLLLADDSAHRNMRIEWEHHINSLAAHAKATARIVGYEHFKGMTSGSQVDMYESMKTLSWKVLLQVFLNLAPANPDYIKVERLQEDMLRGQFSLFPVSINTGVWQSPRKRGIDARKRLQDFIFKRVKNDSQACPFAQKSPESLQEIADHILLFTSSLAAKAMASLLTAFFLNLYMFQVSPSSSLVDKVSTEINGSQREERLRSLLMETERLSPPIVGIMRRSVKENVIRNQSIAADTLIPEGWDAWLFFSGSGRDPAAFGETCDRFDPDRYLNRGTPSPIAFSIGPKTCLGRDLTRDLIIAVAEVCIDLKVCFSGRIDAAGVRTWLGWSPSNEATPEDWAKDMKQLPTQRPANPVFVSVTHDG